jgi:hypothetical protein
MTALASLLRRVGIAINRIPHQTGWGIFGFLYEDEVSLTGWTREKFSEIGEVMQRIAPTVVIIVLNIFR